MKHFLTLLLITSILIPKSSFAQITPREDGSYEWIDPANSQNRESIVFNLIPEEDKYVAIFDGIFNKWDEFRTAKYSIVGDEIIFLTGKVEIADKKYTCRLENGILLVEISELNSSESLKRSYSFNITPIPVIQQPVIIEVPDEYEEGEEIAITFGEEAQEEEVFTIVETQPQFPGGFGELNNWLASNLKYPEEAKKMAVEGRVFVEFIVNTDGSVSDIKVLKSVGSGCDEEAIRLMQSCPKWAPGEQDGRVVRVRITWPVTFKLG